MLYPAYDSIHINEYENKKQLSKPHTLLWSEFTNFSTTSQEVSSILRIVVVCRRSFRDGYFDSQAEAEHVYKAPLL